MNRDQMKAWLKQHGVVEVECIAASMTGDAVGKFISAKKFLDGKLRIPESIVAMTTTGDYPDEHFEHFDARDIDAEFIPDYSTARLVPWAKTPTAQVIHDFVSKDGELHPVSCRTVLKKVLKLYEDEGWIPVVAPEMEFYLVDRNTDPSQELRPPSGLNGRRETVPNAYSVEGINEYSDFVKDLYDTCAKQNIPVEGLVHEIGIAQFEINFDHGNALNLADQVFAFKRTVRQVALGHDMYATFMAKPYGDQPGSAMHIHQSVINKDGNNIFVDEQGEGNETFLHFIGGMQKYTPYCLSLYAPNINSYRRYSPGYCAPANMEWGYENRNVGLRVPDSPPIAKRVENRYPGADSNPYLALAASLACGYLGIKAKVKPSTEPHEGDAGEQGIAVARDLLTSVKLLNEMPELVEILGSRFVKSYQAVKAKEFEESICVITPWEREHLLLNV